MQYFQYGETEIAWLKKRDPKLGEAIDEIGKIDRPVMPDLFEALVNSIVGQQISAKAHDTIWDRIQSRITSLTPEGIAETPIEELQKCGISMRKAEYIKGIAASVLAGELDLDGLHELPDEEIYKRLCKIRGVGNWTAEMIMIFSMQRPDVLSWDDLAIIRGLRMLYRHRKITPALFAKYKRRYSPYSSTASLYLWAISGGK